MEKVFNWICEVRFSTQMPIYTILCENLNLGLNITVGLTFYFTLTFIKKIFTHK